MQITWRGETWGTDVSSDVQVLEAPGLEDWGTSSSSMGGFGDGGATPVTWQKPGSFTVSLLLLAETDAAMAVLLDGVKAVTQHNDDRYTTFPLVYTIAGQDPLTVYARAVNRTPPTDMQTRDRFRACNVLIQFESDDPLTYTAQQTSAALDRGDTLSITGEGWAPSMRWTATIEGPVVNPQISSSLDASAVVRYVGTVAGGETLVLAVTPRSRTHHKDGVSVYPAMDGGASSGRPPQWFPIVAGAQTLTFNGTSGAGTCTFAWREAKP